MSCHVTVAMDDGPYAITIAIPLDDRSAAEVYATAQRMLHAADRAYWDPEEEQ